MQNAGLFFHIQKMVLNPEVVKDLPADEVAALALYGNMAVNYPDQVARLLIAHGEKPSGDPHINLMKLISLSGVRENFFNEDFANMACQTCNFDLSTIGTVFGAVKNLFSKPAAVTDSAGNTSTPAHPFWNKVGGFLGDLFGNKTNAAPPPPQQPQQQSAPAPQQQPMQQMQPLAQNPSAINLKNFITGKDADPNAKDATPQKMILGMKPVYFWGAVVGVVIFIVVAVLVYRHYKKTHGKKGEGK